MSSENFPATNPEDLNEVLLLSSPKTGVHNEVRVTGLAIKLTNKIRGKMLGRAARTNNMEWLLGELEMIPKVKELGQVEPDTSNNDDGDTWQLLRFRVEYVKAEDSVQQMEPSEQRKLVTEDLMTHPTLDILINAAQMMGSREREDLILMQRASALLISNFSE